MSSFDDLYVSSTHLSIHFLYRRKNKPTPALSMRKFTSISKSKYDETVTAMMVIVSKEVTPREIKRRRVVALQEILNDMPIVLRDGTISWLVLEGEEEPSTLIIHTGISMEDLALLARVRLMKIAREKLRIGGLFFILLNFDKIKKESDNIIKETKEQAKQSKLVNSEPVAHYLR
jgi:hypothetical protein